MTEPQSPPEPTPDQLRPGVEYSTDMLHSAGYRTAAHALGLDFWGMDDSCEDEPVSGVFDIDAIEARAAAATSGPWTPHLWVEDGVGEFAVVQTPEHDYAINVSSAGPDRNAVALFVAHAREDVPALVAEVRRLQHALAEAGAR